MKAVILCAGEGVRMRPLTLTRPKALIELGGRPLLEHILYSLPDAVDEVILVVGYLGDQIQKRFGGEFLGKKISYVRQPEKNGTWGALMTAKPLLGDEKFLFLFGDDIIDKESIERCLTHDLAILVKEVEDPKRFGVVVADAHGKAKDFVEKPEIPPSKLASTGVMALDGRVFKYWPSMHRDGEYYLTDAVSQLMRDYDMFVERAKFWTTTSRPEDIPIIEEKLEEYYRREGWNL